MKYIVYRQETRHAVTYKVTEHPVFGETHAVLIGMITAASKANAAHHLQNALRQGLTRTECFEPTPGS